MYDRIHPSLVFSHITIGNMHPDSNGYGSSEFQLSLRPQQKFYKALPLSGRLIRANIFTKILPSVLSRTEESIQQLLMDVCIVPKTEILCIVVHVLAGTCFMKSAFKGGSHFSS